MQIIIDIDEELYNYMKSLKSLPFTTALEDVVMKGIPLPKGHGRLIDEMALGDIISRMWKNKQITNTKYNTFLSILDYVPTIIKADTESEDKKIKQKEIKQ